MISNLTQSALRMEKLGVCTSMYTVDCQECS